MTWNLDFAIFYSYSLVLFGALLLWAVPTVFVALVNALQQTTLQHSTRDSGPPDHTATKKARTTCIQGLWSRLPNLTR